MAGVDYIMSQKLSFIYLLLGYRWGRLSYSNPKAAMAIWISRVGIKRGSATAIPILRLSLIILL